LSGIVTKAKSEIASLGQDDQALASECKNEAKINHTASIQTDLKLKLRQMIDVIQDKITENEPLPEKVGEHAANQRKQAQEISQLCMSNKRSELQVESLTDLSNRDRDVVISQSRFKANAEDGKH
jgi:hypothetical protein